MKQISSVCMRYCASKMQLMTQSLAVIAMLFLTSISLKAADVRVYTFDSQGTPIAGTFKVQKGPNFIGTFNSGDTADLTAGQAYTIWAIYENTSTERISLTVSAGGDSLAFNTTNVKFHFSGGYLNYRGSGSWKSFGPKVNGEWPDRELFPFDFYGDTMKIQTGYVWNDVRDLKFDIYYKGQTSVEKTISVIRVLDSYGNPTSGATARGGYNTPTVWHVPGSTNANGMLVDLRNGKQTNLSYEAKVNNTIAVEGPKNPTTDSYYLFQTDRLVLNLQTCNGQGLAGGAIRYGNGNTYTTWWFPGNPTDANGKVEGQVFPGTYSFEMQYKTTADQKIGVVIPAGGDSLVWNTVNVNLSSSGSISYGGPSGVSTWFTQPSMELLPGTYKFKFNSTGEVKDLTLSGCNFTKSEALVHVLDCDGNHQSGVNIKWYKYGNAANKHDAGLTGASAMSLLIDSGITHIGVVANYLGQNNTTTSVLSVSNVFTFQMIDVEVSLFNHDSTAILAPQDVQFYVYGQASNKMSFPVSLHKCLLPGSYGFVVKYNETSQTRNPVNVSNENPVYFQTGLVEDLSSCTFNPTQYYQYGQASNKHAFVNPMEFMPSHVIVLSSTEPSESINVSGGSIHILKQCAVVSSAVVMMDSCVSDSSWKESTVITASNNSGYWPGVNSLPLSTTFTDSAQVGFPKPWGGMGVVQGSLPIKSLNHIHYFSKNFGLTDTTGLEARFRMYMDDGAEIYINGYLIAREEDMDWNNFNGVPHDLKINNNNTYDNGYLGGDAFDYVSNVNLENIVRKGNNTIVIVLRNPANTKNIGGFSFRMDMSKNGQSVLVKKKKPARSADDDSQMAFEVYPNPVNDILFVNIPEAQNNAAQIGVYSLNGQLMMQQQVSTSDDQAQIDLSGLNTGIYFVRYTSGDVVKHAKIIKR